MKSVTLQRAAKELRDAITPEDEHPALEQELFPYADGTLRGERRAAVEEHLTWCRICREDVADAIRARRGMRRRAPVQQWWLAAAAAIAVAVIASIIWTRIQRVQHTETTLDHVRSVAVLPLKNIGAGRSDDFLAIALADAITTQLHAVPALQVRPMSAVLASSSGVAGLAVDSVIQGRFAVSGNLVQITLWLVDSRSGRSLWSRTISGPRSDLSSVVENVSTQTLVALNDKLGVQQAGHASTPRSNTPAAFEEYLKARAVNQSLLPEKHAEAIAHLQRAIALDPKFAAAYADLSIAISLGRLRGLEKASAGELAERYARDAVQLDPNLAASHLALGRALLATHFRDALREFVQSLRLDPKDLQTTAIMTSYFVATGDKQKAQCAMAHVAAIDPHSQEWITRSYWYIHLLDADATILAANDALATKSHELAGCDAAAHAYILLGKLDMAQTFAERARRVMPSSYLVADIEASIAAARGDRETALRLLQTFAPEATHNRWAAMTQAFVHAKLGDRKDAIFWTRHTASLGSGTWYTFRHHPWTQWLQSDPEFTSTLNSMRADLDSVRPEMLSVYDEVCGPGLQRD